MSNISKNVQDRAIHFHTSVLLVQRAAAEGVRKWASIYCPSSLIIF